MGGIKTTDGIAKEDCLSLPGQDTLCLIIAISTRKSKALMWRLIRGNVLRFLEMFRDSHVWLQIT